MFRSLCVACGLVVVFGGPGRCPAQTKVAPLYSLPADGVWVEFNFESRDRLNKEIKGTLRISSAGTKRIKDNVYRWVEIKMEGSGIQTRYGGMLLAEEALLRGQALEDNILEAYHREGANGRLLQFSGRQLIDYFTMGVSGRLAEINPEEEVVTGLGTRVCKAVESTGKGPLRPARKGAGKEQADGQDQEKPGDRSLRYRAWLCDEVPFGVAKFEIWAADGRGPGRAVFVAVAARSGKGAKSEMVVSGSVADR